jgi:predicted ATPase
MIEGLRTQRGGTFIVQEPESHLHPDAQLAIADFLIYLAQHGRSIIAETHSELILLRIRRRYLETRNARRRVPDVRVLVVGDAAKVRQLEIDDLGRVRNWPAGFLEDATEERLALLEEVASAAERGEG